MPALQAPASLPSTTAACRRSRACAMRTTRSFPTSSRSPLACAP